MKIKPPQFRLDLLRFRYENDLILRLRDIFEPALRSDGGYYCLIGSLLTDEEIDEWKDSDDDYLPLLHLIGYEGESSSSIYRIHDTYDKEVLIHFIETLINEGETDVALYSQHGPRRTPGIGRHKTCIHKASFRGPALSAVR